MRRSENLSPLLCPVKDVRELPDTVSPQACMMGEEFVFLRKFQRRCLDKESTALRRSHHPSGNLSNEIIDFSKERISVWGRRHNARGQG